MRVFRTTFKDRKGRTQEASKWYVEFRDQLDTVRRLPAFTSKAASKELGRNFDKLVSYHKSSGGQTDPALAKWLQSLDLRIRQKLVGIGLLEPERAAIGKTLLQHLDDFTKALRAKGNSAIHVEVVTARARRIIKGCGFRFYSDLNAGKVQSYLNELRQDTEKRRGISAQTFNFHLQAIKQFARWMVKDRRATDNPVAHLDGLNVKLDRRRDRRALTVDELRNLLQTTQSGPDREGMTGKERALAYRLAVETGLRVNELRSLTRASFALDGNEPTVTVLAAYSKRRRNDTLPLRADLAAELRTFLATKLPKAPAFNLPRRKPAAKMFQDDLAAAGIPFRDDAGSVMDWHGLRHSFLTFLAQGGVHPKTAQALARHSTITLTMDRYSHSLRQDETQALETLPDLSTAPQEALRASGTDGRLPTAPKPGRQAERLGVQLGASEGTCMPRVGANGRTGGEAVATASATQPVSLQGKPQEMQQAGVYGNRTHLELCSNPTLVLKTRAPTRGANTPEGHHFTVAAAPGCG
jgi:integrase/recombinase XerD